MATSRNPPNRSAQFFIGITKVSYYFGLPYICLEKESPKLTTISIRLYQTVTNVIMFVLVMMELGSLFSQQQLTEKQKSDSMLFGLSHPLIFFGQMINITYNIDDVRSLLYNLVVVLKEIYNDEKVEMEMIRKIKFYIAALTSICVMTVFTYGFNALLQVIRNGETFAAVITIWPEVEDRSTIASCARIVIYVVLCMFLARLLGVYLLVIPTTICLSHQYKQLQSYFRNLDDIFNENLNQIEKEQKYESAMKVGIQLYTHTRWCVKLCQKSFGVALSTQIVLNIEVLVFVMSQMMTSERTLLNVFTMVFTGFSLLTGTGLFMLNAGEITVQEAELSTAVYYSGWQNCHLSPGRVKHLVVSTMRTAQQPEIIWALGVVPLSYESYIKIVKSSYSVFSVLY